MNIEQMASIGLRDDLSRSASISHNLANALTPGFKATRVLPAAFTLELSLNAADPASALVPPGAPTTSINALPGSLRPTSVASDVAIEGDSWFELGGRDGSAYTKVGRLTVGRDGTLLGPGNLPIMGEGGTIHLDAAPFSVNAKGEVIQNDVRVGTLRRIRIEHADTMVAAGDGVYLPGAARVVDARATDAVRSGVLEASNVDSAGEMVRLTETVRHFESLQKIVQGYDATLEATIRKLGEF
jgi:flagellar basal body rod protein FlgG